MKRKALSKKLRFDVFKRDGFVCQYCGATPPSTVLEIDHINPVSKGGTDHIDNLLTSCFSCNRGKSAGLLTIAPATVAEKAAVLAEKEEQLKQFERLVKKSKRRIEADIDAIESVFRETFSTRQFTPKFRVDLRVSFLGKLLASDLIGYMECACIRNSNDPDRAIKYFCGICWNKIKGREPRYGSR